MSGGGGGAKYEYMDFIQNNFYALEFKCNFAIVKLCAGKNTSSSNYMFCFAFVLILECDVLKSYLASLNQYVYKCFNLIQYRKCKEH